MRDPLFQVASESEIKSGKITIRTSSGRWRS